MKKPLSFLLAIAFVFSCFSVNVFASVRVASAFDYGDVNGDRYINAKDALLVLQGAVGKIQLADQQHTAADVTQDGQPDGKDALEILKKAVGKPADFPGYVIPSVSEAVKDTVHVASLWASDYADNTQIGKVWQTAFDDLVKRKGIATGVQPLRDENLVERLVANSRAGLNDVDLYEVSPAVALGVARKGLAADLNTSKTLQLERFHENATAHMTFGNSLYGVGITANITQPTVVFYNKNYIERYAPDTNIPALVKNKQWTFEAFTALAKACQIDTDGNGKLDIYGFTANHQRIDALVAANKGGLATMEQGRVVTSVELEKSKNDINWLRSWFINDRVWKLTGRNLDEQTVFAQGEAAMLVSPLNNHKAITQKAPFPVGIAPMPMGPDATHYNT
ncbi:MAG: extracellular solute-binding protein, partial [Clostridia bacterium]|nr:extracellular solute-binding protein [Clostridia bacterium]